MFLKKIESSSSENIFCRCSQGGNSVHDTIALFLYLLRIKTHNSFENHFLFYIISVFANVAAFSWKASLPRSEVHSTCIPAYTPRTDGAHPTLWVHMKFGRAQNPREMEHNQSWTCMWSVSIYVHLCFVLYWKEKKALTTRNLYLYECILGRPHGNIYVRYKRYSNQKKAQSLHVRITQRST